jgi:hypothetical protein
MPLNNHPSAKPTYDVCDTVPVGKRLFRSWFYHLAIRPGSADLGEPRRELPKRIVDMALALA